MVMKYSERIRRTDASTGVQSLRPELKLAGVNQWFLHVLEDQECFLFCSVCFYHSIAHTAAWHQKKQYQVLIFVWDESNGRSPKTVMTSLLVQWRAAELLRLLQNRLPFPFQTWNRYIPGKSSAVWWIFPFSVQAWWQLHGNPTSPSNQNNGIIPGHIGCQSPPSHNQSINPSIPPSPVTMSFDRRVQ